MGKIKKILSFVFAALIILSVFSACGCVKKISEDEAKAHIKRLVDASYEVNVIVYEGLPYFDRIDTQGMLYAPVDDTTKYSKTADIKLAIRKVFSSDYSKILESLAFEGQEGASFGYHTQPRYIDRDEELLVLKDFYETDFESEEYGTYEGIKVLKYNTSNIEIVKISKRFVEGKITSEDGKTTITVTLILEDGEWKLDSPTY